MTVCSSAPHSGCRGVHTPFVRAGAKTSDTGAEAVKPDRRCSCGGYSLRVGVGDETAESFRVLQSLRIPLVMRRT